MKILIFSMGPIFKEVVQGGSQKILGQVATRLGLNNAVTVICPKREDNKYEFKLSKGVTVKPILEFKSYPEPYYIAPFELANNVDYIHREIEKHDVIYIHDSEMNFFFLHEVKKPIVCSLRDYVYPDTLVGAFNFRRDRIIVNSQFTKDSSRYTIGRYMPEINNRIILIPNGFDLGFFKKTKPNKILNFLPKITSKNITIYPNRPDERKGIFIVLDAISKLKHTHKITDIVLLIPEHVDMNVEDGKKSRYGAEYYRKVKEVAKELDIEDNIIFHKWIPLELMPEYYSLAKLTFSVGSFIEAFGSNSSVESVCCGTPAIVSKVGAQRYTFPKNLVPKVDYNDIEQIVTLAVKILSFGYDLTPAQQYIKQHYGYNDMLEGYEEIITTTKISKKIKPSFTDLDFQKAVFKLPPWCSIGAKGLYNDYKYDYQNIEPNILKLLKQKGEFSILDAENVGLDKSDIVLEIRKGNLVYDQ